MKASDTVLTDEQLEENIRKDYKEFTIKEQSDEIQDILIWTREAQAKETLRQIVEWLKDNNVIAIGKKTSLGELGLLLTMEKWTELKREVKK